MAAVGALATFLDVVKRLGPRVGYSAAALYSGSAGNEVWQPAGQQLANLVDEAQDLLFHELFGQNLDTRFTLSTVQGAIQYDVPALTIGGKNYNLNLDRIDGAYFVLSGAHMPLGEGIPPTFYTDTAQAYPQRFKRWVDPNTGTERIEIWPTPDGVYTINFYGRIALPTTNDPATPIMLPSGVVYAKSLAMAQAAAGDAMWQVSEKNASRLIGRLKAEAHGNRRYVQGEPQPMEPRPKIV